MSSDKCFFVPQRSSDAKLVISFLSLLAGVDTKAELDLLEIAKAAVNAPLPPEWEEYEDDSGEVLFFNVVSKKTSEHHPLDAYFLELVRQRRAVRAAQAAANGGGGSRPRTVCP